MIPFLILMTVMLAITSLIVWSRLRTARRAEYIRSYTLPRGIMERLQRRHPQLTLKDCQLVNKGLRQFFLAYHKGGYKYVSMPSQVADDLWHEFILYTKHYEQFCKQAFGRFLHHTPAAVLSSGKKSDGGLRRCWWYTCKEEFISPKRPTRLPLLFALDAKLSIANGFHYATDCEALRSQPNGRVIYCGGDFSNTNNTDGCGGGDSSDSSDSSSDGDSGGSDSGCGGGGD